MIQPVSAQDKHMINVFKRDDCVHCKSEKEFLEDLESKRDDIVIKYYDVNEEEGKKLWSDVAELEKISKVTPITIIGHNLIIGFDKPETTGREITEILDKSEKQSISVEEFIQNGGSKSQIESNSTCDDPNVPCTIEPDPMYVKIPFFGVVNVKEYSLGLLAAVLGLIDGFNPCAMWVLITFMIVLVQVGDKRKMWTIAGLFIIAETMMYHLILSLWFTTWDFVGLNKIVIPIVGIVSLGSGAFFLYEWKTGDGTCQVTNMEQKRKISLRIKDLAKQKFTLFTFLGIIGLAFSVNIIEFACSIGIPQTFTKIIELNNLGFWHTELYLLTYILFYMVDDFIVFGLALYSFEKVGLTQKYAKYSNFIGGILMILLGLILLLKPELLYLF